MSRKKKQPARRSRSAKPEKASVRKRLNTYVVALIGLLLLIGVGWNLPSQWFGVESSTSGTSTVQPAGTGSTRPVISSNEHVDESPQNNKSLVRENPPTRPQPKMVQAESLPARDADTRPPPKRRKDRYAKVESSLGLLDSQLTSLLSFTEHPVWILDSQATKAKFLWGNIPAPIRKQAVEDTAAISNICPDDYVGAEACQSCHPKKYEAWSQHPHRWMNEHATTESVQGDFSGEASISYRGGIATFYLDDGEYRMRLERDGIVRLYSVRRTIGSRFQQYYVGRLLDGPEPNQHPVRRIDYVLPFGYWLDRKQWVPVVHVDLELPDEKRHDPFLHPAHRPYDRNCASCHTTQVAGDRLLRAVGRERLAAYAPNDVLFNGLGYLQENRKEVLEWADFYGKGPQDKVRKALNVMDDLAAETYAAALGITCEGCHNGAKFHAEQETLLPRFFPAGKQLAVFGENASAAWGRNNANANWTCAQCHTGGRSTFACGASTWNSTEYSDAMRGHCYDPQLAQQNNSECLTCVHCHDPHAATGKRWRPSPADDDQRCIACHQQFLDPMQRRSHTHHPAGTSGDRCMNCHMPKINEGMQDVVRTHLIFNPTDTAMLEANDPNACNLCHLDQDIDWTLHHLGDWYGLAEQGSAAAETPTWKIYDETKINANYPNRHQPLGLSWLQSNNEATRLVAVEALGRADAKWALPQMIEMLNDAYLLNRQFAMQRIEEMLGIDLQRFGYRHYQFASERQEPIERIRSALTPSHEQTD